MYMSVIRRRRTAPNIRRQWDEGIKKITYHFLVDSAGLQRTAAEWRVTFGDVKA